MEQRDELTPSGAVSEATLEDLTALALTGAHVLDAPESLRNRFSPDVRTPVSQLERDVLVPRAALSPHAASSADPQVTGIAAISAGTPFDTKHGFVDGTALHERKSRDS